MSLPTDCSGPTSLPVAGHAVVGDAFTVPSHFVGATRCGAVSVPCIVMQPLLDAGPFDPDAMAPHDTAAMCAARFGKAPGQKMIGALSPPCVCGHCVAESPRGCVCLGARVRVCRMNAYVCCVCVCACAGMVARLVSTKSPGMFVRAAAIIRQRYPTALFAYAGSSPPDYLEALQILAGDLGLLPQVPLDVYVCVFVCWVS